MGWSGSLSSSSAVGSKITYTPDTSSEGGYTVTSFTAPKKGVYKFQLKGSGGSNGSTETEYTGAFTNANLPGGSGGSTDGYLLLEKGQTVYIGAGGPCSAAFVSAANGSKLSAIGSGNLYFVAGAGGGAGMCYRGADYKNWGNGGSGGGRSGTNGYSNNNQSQSAGGAGTQSSGGAAHSGSTAGSYGTGGAGAYKTTNGCPAWGGRGGDGYYGGGGGGCTASHNSETGATSSYGYGGGGGSGYVKTASFSLLGRTYTSSTSQGGGAGSGANGSVSVTYYARALLPVVFDGVQLERLFFNGTEIESLTYNGTLIYMRRGIKWLLRRMTRSPRRGRCWARPMRSLTAST